MDKALLFDFDGTLADTLEFYIKAYGYALKKLGVIWDNKEIVENCFGKTESDICGKLGKPDEVDNFQRNYFLAVKKLFAKAKLFGDTMPVLEFARKSGYKLGIITFGYRWYIDMMLKQFNLDNYFDKVISSNDVTKIKPDPEAVLKICKQLNVEPNQTYVIGDSKSDILMGKAAGSKTILVTPEKYNYFTNVKEILTAKPDFVIKNLEDIKGII